MNWLCLFYFIYFIYAWYLCCCKRKTPGDKTIVLHSFWRKTLLEKWFGSPSFLMCFWKILNALTLASELHFNVIAYLWCKALAEWRKMLPKFTNLPPNVWGEQVWIFFYFRFEHINLFPPSPLDSELLMESFEMTLRGLCLYTLRSPSHSAVNPHSWSTQNV